MADPNAVVELQRDRVELEIQLYAKEHGISDLEEAAGSYAASSLEARSRYRLEASREILKREVYRLVSKKPGKLRKASEAGK